MEQFQGKPILSIQRDDKAAEVDGQAVLSNATVKPLRSLVKGLGG